MLLKQADHCAVLLIPYYRFSRSVLLSHCCLVVFCQISQLFIGQHLKGLFHPAFLTHVVFWLAFVETTKANQKTTRARNAG